MIGAEPHSCELANTLETNTGHATSGDQAG